MESPYHGVRLTGKDKVVDKICQVELPHYIRDLIHEEDVNIQISNIKHGSVLWIEDVTIKENMFTVCCENDGEYEFYWSFTGIRKDVDELEVESGN